MSSFCFYTPTLVQQRQNECYIISEKKLQDAVILHGWLYRYDWHLYDYIYVDTL